MKKVLTIAIALVAAISARAAAVDWSLDRGAVDGYTEGGLVMAFLDSDRAAVTSAINGAADASSLASALNDFAHSSGNFNKRGAADGSISADSITSGTSYDVFVVAFDAPSIAESTKVLVGSGKASAKGYEPPSSAEVVANYSSVSGTWTAIPEPCSVALLAIGLAAFGLKRKVA